uniref:Uncharacterized protein n=1 Tax=Aegilops tauschii subsp. strangulata TaxID=200361 RepID=A0A453PD28_AEGTS
MLELFSYHKIVNRLRDRIVRPANCSSSLDEPQYRQLLPGGAMTVDL